MNLLVIGNGFDLAHGLPTKYTDFLKYCRDYGSEVELISNSKEQNDEFAHFLKENIWLSYFLKITPDLDGSKNWIDFEKEIAEVVREIEAKGLYFARRGKGMYVVAPCKNDANKIRILLEGIPAEVGIEGMSLEDLAAEFEEIWPEGDEVMIRLLYQHLRQFARAFEIYCLRVNALRIKSPVSCELKDKLDEIQRRVSDYTRMERAASRYASRQSEAEGYRMKRNAEMEEYRRLTSQIGVRDYLSQSKFNYVLSFNYTNTYEQLYGNADTKYCYIHGKAQTDSKKTNLIFGIDDDLPQGRESSDFKWVSFKKYYQRIIYRTGSEYKDWLAVGSHSVRSDQPVDYVYIVGHSLDRTDWDVLYEIFSNPRFKIIVFYYSQADFEDKVQKVIRLLACRGANGRDELIRRVHGAGWTIRFSDQYDEKEGLFVRT